MFRRTTTPPIAPDESTSHTSAHPPRMPRHPPLAEQVATLAAIASRLELADPAWSQTRRSAHEVTAQLVSQGVLPCGLVVALADPPVVVARTIALIQRHLASV